MQNKTYELKKISQENQSLNNDLEKANDEYTKLTQRMNQTETSLKSMQSKLNEKQEEVLFFF